MDPYRLPRNVVPTRYDLRLEPDLQTFTFAGEETVTLAVREATREILLNAVELSIERAEIAEGSGRTLSAAVALDEASERCRLTFAEPIAPGTWRLRLVFRGTLNDKLHGFYRSTYKDAAGRAHTLAATQFEATDARRAFPCWDEPALKAVFASTLVIDPALVALSNTAVTQERVEKGRKVVRFADTIPMSTYLVAFVVGELEATEAVSVGGTPLRVVCTPGKQRLAAFGQAIGAYSLKLYEDYYGQPYPGDKLDLVAIPDFAAGAMENLGAITFRETALLVDESAATHAELERVADVVAHENAHMWFGDLVTMSWWNGLWLNEAFATFLEMVGRCLETGMAALDDVRRVALGGAVGGRAAQHAADRVPGGRPQGRRRHVRRFDLREGGVGAAHDGAVPGRRRVPGRGALLPGAAQVRQHRNRRPVVGPGRGVAPADPRDHGRLGVPRRLPAGQRPPRRTQA